MSHCENYLVVGANGKLGQAIVEQWQKRPGRIIKTSRRPSEESEIFLDLAQEIDERKLPDHITAAFLCAAQTKTAECRRHPQKSAEINVKNTIHLAQSLARTGAFIVFPSTNMVFDGSVPRIKANAAFSPQTEYGRQKALVEQEIMALPKSAILRFTKIIDKDFALLRNWRKALLAGKTIHPFDDMFFAPISMTWAAQITTMIVEQQREGIWQISAGQDISYAESARLLAKKLSVSLDLVQPVSAMKSGMDIEFIAPHTTLDTERLQREIGVNAPDARKVLLEVIELW